jgi:hypothetical protein
MVAMFLFSVSKSFVISNHTNKADFAETLVNKLLPKFHHPHVAIINDGYELVFSGGFTEVLMRFNWISDGLIRVTFTESQLWVEYELNFRYTFWIFCFVTLFLIISIISEYFSLRPGSIVPQLWGMGMLWGFYAAIVYLTTVIFDLRMGKTINEVELSKENISEEQLNWMSRPDTCPACGYSVQIQNTVCPDCGLRL